MTVGREKCPPTLGPIDLTHVIQCVLVNLTLPKCPVSSPTRYEIYFVLKTINHSIVCAREGGF